MYTTPEHDRLIRIATDLAAAARMWRGGKVLGGVSGDEVFAVAASLHGTILMMRAAVKRAEEAELDLAAMRERAEEAEARVRAHEKNESDLIACLDDANKVIEDLKELAKAAEEPAAMLNRSFWKRVSGALDAVLGPSRPPGSDHIAK